jgi:putative ATP-binding cassette transporter
MQYHISSMKGLPNMRYKLPPAAARALSAAFGFVKAACVLAFTGTFAAMLYGWDLGTGDPTLVSYARGAGIVLVLSALTSSFMMAARHGPWRAWGRSFVGVTAQRTLIAGLFYWHTVRSIVKPVTFHVARNILLLISFGKIDLAKVEVSGTAVSAIAWLLWGWVTSLAPWPVTVPKSVSLPWLTYHGFRAAGGNVSEKPWWKRWSLPHWFLLAAGGASAWLLMPEAVTAVLAWIHAGQLGTVAETPTLLNIIWANLDNWHAWAVIALTIATVKLSVGVLQAVRAFVPLPHVSLSWHEKQLPAMLAGRHLCTLPEFGKAWLLLGLVGLGTYIVNVYIGATANELNGELMNSLQAKDLPKFMHTLFLFSQIIGFGLVFNPTYLIVKRWTFWGWNEYATRINLAKYVDGKAQGYYPIWLLRLNENTNERIDKDLKVITTTTALFLFAVLDALVSLYVYGIILWKIEAKLSFEFTVFGQPLVVNHLLLMILVGYAIVGTNGAAFVGQQLRRLNVENNKLSAYFRANMVLFERNAELIASYQGEEREYTMLWRRYKAALANTYSILRWQWALGVFTGAYNKMSQFLPLLTIAPFYFSGKVELGAISRTNGACAEILGAFSIFVEMFQDLTEVLAAGDRVSELNNNLDKVEAERTDSRPRIKRIEGGEVLLSFDDLKLYGLGSKLIVDGFSLTMTRGQNVVVRGESGSGKTSLIRASAGLPLCDIGSGIIRVTARKRMIVATQQAYLVTEADLRGQLEYPTAVGTSDSTLIAKLMAVNLEDWMYTQLMRMTVQNWETIGPAAQMEKIATAKAVKLLSEAKWQKVLLSASPNWWAEMSGGERQRLVVARALVNGVELALCDEATSGLDEKNQKLMFKVLHEAGITTLAVSHSAEVLECHADSDLVVELLNDGKGGTQRMTVAECKKLLDERKAAQAQ